MEIALASFLNIASVCGLGYLNACLKKERLKLSEIEGAKVYSPSRLLSHLMRPEFLAKLAKNPENPDEFSFKTFIEGYVNSTNPIKSLIDGKTKLVHSLYFKDEIYSNDTLAKARGFLFPNNESMEIRAPLFFNLKDPNRNISCNIHRNLAVDAKYALEKIAESREYKRLNWFEKILVYVGLLIELVALVTRTTFVFRGVKIGWTENEFGIMLGTALTAYGEVIYNLKENSLRMDRPEYYLHDKSNIVKRLKESIYGIQGKMMLLVIPLVLTSIYLTKKALSYYSKIRRRRMEKRFDKLWKVKSVKMKDDYKCIICYDRPRNIIAKPCLHFSMCSTCCSRLDKKICPICKRNISDHVEVFFT